MRVLVTGAAGFIGFHLSRRLLEMGHTVVGIDTINDYYDPQLKQARLDLLRPFSGFAFHKIDLADQASLRALFHEQSFSHVINMAAQAGVRYSLTNPASYVQSNLVGFANLLECCRAHPVEHLVFASSSSVYGLNKEMPFSTSHNADHPASLYAATKKAGEAMAHSYSHLYGIACTGLRFFTVYGPWGRPDMALFIFTRAILRGEKLPLFNKGQMRRDFTYIDDITSGVLSLLDKAPVPSPDWDAERHNPATSSAPYRLFNIGNNQPLPLLDFVRAIEDATGHKADMDLLPMQPGDVQETFADITPLQQFTGFAPTMPVQEGVRRFVDWYKAYYQEQG